MAGDAIQTLADRVAALDAAVEALQGLQSVVHQCPSGRLADLAGQLGQVAALATAGVTGVTADAESRGVVAASQCASTTGWITEYVWHLRSQAPTLAKAVRVLRRPELAEVADGVLTADIDAGLAVVIAAQYDLLVPELKTEAAPIVLRELYRQAAEHGAKHVKDVRAAILANWGRDGKFQDEQDACRRHVALSAGRECRGVWHHDLVLDAEGHAIAEAAIALLSAPRQGPDGEPDSRPVGRRRGEALVEMLRRGITAGPSTQVKTTLMITMTLDDLTDRVGAGIVLGSRDAGSLLAPETVRRLACDAQIIPVVLGSRGEPLDVGRAERLFTPAQTRALWLRDRHCTWAGCTAPAHWCEAHHLVHWADGGATDLDNGGLLCGRHHTVVHRDRLAGTVTEGRVAWNSEPGSYRPATRPTTAGSSSGRRRGLPDHLVNQDPPPPSRRTVAHQILPTPSRGLRDTRPRDPNPGRVAPRGRAPSRGTPAGAAPTRQ